MHRVLEALGSAIAKLGLKLSAILLNPGSTFSIWSLGVAFLIAILVLSHQRRRRGRKLRPATMLRAVLPGGLLRRASVHADLGFFVLNNFAASVLIGWAIVSFTSVNHSATAVLDALFGAPRQHAGMLWAELTQTVAMFLAAEFAYWLDHWLSHTVPFLWEFHRVHHTAETLTPATVYRVHPVDSLVYYNMTVLILGVVSAITTHVTGVPAAELTVGGTNVLIFAGILLVTHLQHSHVWIAFTGIWGRLFLSPAHHQIHHSREPAHYGKNLGSTLAIFDWAFGTLLVPEARQQKLVFGAAEPGEAPHAITGALVTPFARAAATLWPRNGEGGKSLFASFSSEKEDSVLF